MVRFTNEDMKKELKSYLKKMNTKFKIEKAILFGSRARGDFLLSSDVDLLLVSKDFKAVPFRTRLSEAIDWWSGCVDLEVLCYSPTEYEKKKKQLGIVQQAVKEGIEI